MNESNQQGADGTRRSSRISARSEAEDLQTEILMISDEIAHILDRVTFLKREARGNL